MERWEHCYLFMLAMQSPYSQAYVEFYSAEGSHQVPFEQRDYKEVFCRLGADGWQMIQLKRETTDSYNQTEQWFKRRVT